jgi:ribulose-bisphosphate carboxylase large chain
VTRVVNEHADKTGKKVMVAFNLTGDIDEMLRRHDLVLGHGGGCVMVNVLAVGLSSARDLAKTRRAPYPRSPRGLGDALKAPAPGEWTIRSTARSAALRGADHLHVNGLRNKFCEADGSVIASAKGLLAPLGNAAPGDAGFFVRAVGRSRPGHLRGARQRGPSPLGGRRHPGAPGRGGSGCKEYARSLGSGVAGSPLDEYARTHPALKVALERFGP